MARESKGTTGTADIKGMIESSKKEVEAAYESEASAVQKEVDRLKSGALDGI